MTIVHPPLNRVLIFGRRGYLAQAFARAWGDRAHVFGTDITDAVAVREAITGVAPTLVLNAAGKTHGTRYANIDGCEESREARIATHVVNVLGAQIVRDACAQAGVRLVHLGSGCVFDGYGDTPIDETTPPNPQSWYAETKAIGDLEVAESGTALVARIRMPISGDGHPRCLLTKLRQYTDVVDAPNSVTVVSALIVAVEQLVERGCTGVYHVVNPDPISPYGVATRLRSVADHRWPGRLTPEQLNGRVVARRSNCVLSTAKLAAEGIRLGRASTFIENWLNAAAPERVP